MSKAEIEAKKRYTISRGDDTEETSGIDMQRAQDFIDGYHQAEKDLVLGWEDIKNILDIENDIIRECNCQMELVIETYPKGEDYYGEILKRFKERKEQ